MKVTKNQIERIKKDLEFIAKEEIVLDIMEFTAYAYCSEIASLRLLKAYRNVENATADYSNNLNSHYFALEMNI